MDSSLKFKMQILCDKLSALAWDIQIFFKSASGNNVKVSRTSVKSCSLFCESRLPEQTSGLYRLCLITRMVQKTPSLAKVTVTHGISGDLFLNPSLNQFLAQENMINILYWGSPELLPHLKLWPQPGTLKVSSVFLKYRTTYEHVRIWSTRKTWENSCCIANTTRSTCQARSGMSKKHGGNLAKQKAWQMSIEDYPCTRYCTKRRI